MTSATAQKAIGLTDLIGSIATEAVRAGNTAQEVATFLSGVKLIARFVPGLSTAVAILDVAQPIIQKIAAAAPVVSKAIAQGDQLVAAAQSGGLLDSAKQLYALAVNKDPERPEVSLSPAQVSNAVALDLSRHR